MQFDESMVAHINNDLAPHFFHGAERDPWCLNCVEAFTHDEDGDYFLIFENDSGGRFTQAFYDSISDELKYSPGISSHKGGEIVWEYAP